MADLIHPLDAISPIDGRYRRVTNDLAPIFSEHGLIARRDKVEIEYLKALIQFIQPGGRTLTDLERLALDNIAQDVLELPNAQIVKDIEVRGYGQNKKTEDEVKDVKPHIGYWKIQKTNHDVKAVELYIYLKLKEAGLEWLIPWVHLFCTSEDINNIAYAMQLRDGLEDCVLPDVDTLYEDLVRVAKEWGNIPMLARTHGQPASPTTLGKEFSVFAARLRRQYDLLQSAPILVKLNGATGNYNAHKAAYPAKNWERFSLDFVGRLNADSGEGHVIRFELSLHTTQIEPHDSYAQLFQTLQRINTILIKLCKDVWQYISDEWLVQAAVEGEVGSSTMPNKVNPIDWEQAEGNLLLANALCEFFARTLPDSRLQRHLSDSTISRNFGVCFGHCLIGYAGIQRGMDKISPNIPRITADLERYPEVIAEAYQVILRREGVADAYDQLKEVTRGKAVTLELLHQFVDGLPISDKVKAELKAITPTNYIGLAAVLAGTEFSNDPAEDPPLDEP